jgi:hypothetical protein
MSTRKNCELVRESDLLRPPYRVVKNPNLTISDYTIPADMICCKISAVLTQNTPTLLIDTDYCTREELTFSTTKTDYEVRATKLYSVANGSGAGLETSVTVLLQHINDLYGVE